MPSPMNHSAIPLIALEMDKTGRFSRKTMEMDREATLENTLLHALYPEIRVLTVDVPQEPLDSFEQAIVEQALVRLEVDGVRYSLIGATGSAKNGKFYAVDAAHEKKVAERFRLSPQSAITYFGILVSSCKVRIEEPDCRVLVVDDLQFGTNDCRGWISQSLFAKLQVQHQANLLATEMGKLLQKRKNDPQNRWNEDELLLQAKQNIRDKILPAHRFYQFRLAFDRTQAKGSFKVMADEVAQKIEADIILPKSAIKPEYKGGLVRSLRSLLGDQQAHSCRGPLVPGIRDSLA